MTSLFQMEMSPCHELRGGLLGPVLAEPPLLVPILPAPTPGAGSALSLRAGAASALQMGKLRLRLLSR